MSDPMPAFCTVVPAIAGTFDEACERVLETLKVGNLPPDDSWIANYKIIKPASNILLTLCRKRVSVS